MRDSDSVAGDEYQTEFITDLQTQIDILKKKQYTGGDVPMPDLDNYYDKETIDGMFENFESGLQFESVLVPPNKYKSNTLYGIIGVVVVE